MSTRTEEEGETCRSEDARQEMNINGFCHLYVKKEPVRLSTQSISI